ncbi:MAG: decaprenyl-phosphate phosphoribosyltransferase [Deltaproteobacteria bacterium]
MRTLKYIVETMRPKQWVKNFFVFASLLFSGHFFMIRDSLPVILVFFCFCAASSAVYTFNDIMDREKDRRHAVKCNRPLAAGRLSIRTAATASASLAVIAGIILLRLGNPKVALIVLMYLALNVLYSSFLKRKVIVDAFCVALGFELRVWAGSLVMDMHPSAWLQVCTFLIALFLSFGKRREELIKLKDDAVDHRHVLAKYTVPFIDQLITVSGVVAILAYTLYTLSPEIALRTRGMLIYTVPFAMYGIFRYLYLVSVKEKGGDPGEVLMKDLPMFLDLACWFGGVLFIIYVRGR